MNHVATGTGWSLDIDGALEPAVLVLHEGGRRWVDALRGRLSAIGVRVCHAATVRDTLEFVGGRELPIAVVVELGSRPVDSLHLMEALGATAPAAAVIVVAGKRQADLELPVRELGAVGFQIEPLTAVELAGFVASLVQRRRADRA